jgi:hypothetical protein
MDFPMGNCSYSSSWKSYFQLVVGLWTFLLVLPLAPKNVTFKWILQWGMALHHLHWNVTFNWISGAELFM